MLEATRIEGRHGLTEGPAGVVAEVAGDLSIATIAERRSGSSGLAEIMAVTHGLTLPRQPAHVSSGHVDVVCTGPGRWLALSVRPGLADDLARNLNGVASVTEQSDAFVLVHLSGAQARRCLAKGLPVDLDPAVFGPGHAATSVIGHIGVTLWCLDATPRFALLIARSYWVSFMAWLIASGAEYGIEVSLPQGRG